MASFDRAISYVLDNENGGTDRGVEVSRSDAGGATRFGITHTKAAEHGFDLNALTIDDARAIYRSDYWRFDEIRDQRVATKCLDIVVNFGLAGGMQIIQAACSVKPDGIPGPMTTRAINALPPTLALELLARAAADHYCDITRADVMHRIEIGNVNSVRIGASNLENLKGWIRRAIRLPLAVFVLFFACASIEQFPRRACVYDEAQRWDTGTVVDKREDGARLFRFDDRSRGDLGYMWVSEDDPSRQIRPCVAADALTPDAAEALQPKGDSH